MTTLYGPWTASEDGRHLYDDSEHDIRLDIDGDWPSVDARITFADVLAHALNNAASVRVGVTPAAAAEIARLRANITTMEAAARAAIEIVRTEQKAKLASLLQEIDYGRFHGRPSETLQRLDEIIDAAMKDKP